MSGVGGALGLFAGFSILTAFEQVDLMVDLVCFIFSRYRRDSPVLPCNIEKDISKVICIVLSFINFRFLLLILAASPR